MIKLGEKGALTLANGEVTEQAAMPIDIVDTVGAGDAFVGGYLSEWVRGADPATCLRTAVPTGALACTAAGDREGSPSRDQLHLIHHIDPVTR